MSKKTKTNAELAEKEQTSIEPQAFERTYRAEQNSEAIPEFETKLIDEFTGKVIYYGKNANSMNMPEFIETYGKMFNENSITTIRLGKDFYTFAICQRMNELTVEKPDTQELMFLEIGTNISLQNKEQPIQFAQLVSNGEIFLTSEIPLDLLTSIEEIQKYCVTKTQILEKKVNVLKSKSFNFDNVHEEVDKIYKSRVILRDQAETIKTLISFNLSTKASITAWDIYSIARKVVFLDKNKFTMEEIIDTDYKLFDVISSL